MDRTQTLQQASTAAIMRVHVEPTTDIQAERKRATFNNERLMYLLNGGKEKLEKRRKFAEILAQTSWGDKSRRHFLSREEEYVGALKAALGIWEKMKTEGLSLEDGAMMRTLVDFPGGLELHIGMFIPSIVSQASPEQQAHWMPLSMGLKVIGTYAQTELGHGTFVRGLETTATYDPQTQEFIIHSPTLTATKWWPGGLGKTATHAVVMARLFTQGKDHGPHGFIVQLRDMATHLPLPGIRIGDIGPKAGYNGVDNGFMSFDHVRVPRDAMLMRFSKVLPDGSYVPPPPANSKASYATMVFVRADIVKNAGGAMAKAATIATRYAAVRRQTAPGPGQREVQVLDYQNCSNVLLPLIATAYANHFMGEDMMAMYRAFEKARNANDFSSLPELHALSSGLKAFCTWATADGIEECRRTCGGHGYSRLSGLPTLLLSYVQNVTWEGDNNVLCLQTARYLLKALHAAQQQGTRPQGSATYLADAGQELKARCSARGTSCWQQPDVQLAALRHIATRLAVSAAALLAAASPGGKVAYEGVVWNSNTVDLIRLAKAHCMLVMQQTFLNSIQAMESRGEVDTSTLTVLRQLASLYCLTHLERTLPGDLLEDGYVSGAQLADLRAAQRSLLVALRPNAVALVDAFGFEDYALNSALGRYDGDVYRGLLAMADNQLALNSSQEGPAWHEVLKPVLAATSKL